MAALALIAAAGLIRGRRRIVCRPLSDRTLLIIRRDRDGREALAVLLELEGARVSVAPTADAALAQLSRVRRWPRAVVADLPDEGRQFQAFVERLRALESRLGREPTPVLRLGSPPGTVSRPAEIDRLIDAIVQACRLRPPIRATEQGAPS